MIGPYSPRHVEGEPIVLGVGGYAAVYEYSGPDAQRVVEVEVEAVLLADDSPTMRALLHGALAEAGFDVVLAEDGATASELLDLRPCDAVVSDVQMPRCDGWDLLRKVGGRIPVILATSFPRPEDEEKALGLGAVAYLGKDEGVGQRAVDALVAALGLSSESDG